MTSFHFESCLRKVNYRINHAEGQAETSLQVLHACMNIFHFWLTQYVTIAVWWGRKEEEGKKTTLLNWCTTHVSASWLGRKIRGKCRKIYFLLQCSHFPFNSGHSGFLTSQNLGCHTHWQSLQYLGYQITWTRNYNWPFQPYLHLEGCMS